MAIKHFIHQFCPEMKILSFTYTLVAPNLYDFLSSEEHKSS